MRQTYLDSLAMLGVGGAHPGGLQVTKKMLAKENLQASTKILDVGCGTGQTSAFIRSHYKSKVIALDANPIMVKKAKDRFVEKGLSIEIHEGKTEKLPFESGFFDYVLSESVIAFTDIAATISECKRVLKPGGVLLAIEMTADSKFGREELQEVIDFYGISQLLTESDWCNAFQKGGFTHIDSEKVVIEFDPEDLENAPDFSISKDADDVFFEILLDHQVLTEKLVGKLGFRIFRCQG